VLSVSGITVRDKVQDESLASDFTIIDHDIRMDRTVHTNRIVRLLFRIRRVKELRQKKT
jgi:hypothetical protein